MSISFALSLAFYTREKKFILLLVSGIIFIAAILTFSRSTYLAFLTVLATIGILKSPRLLLAFLGIFLIAFFSVPQVKTRVAGALSVDETAQARLESWEKAIVIFQRHSADWELASAISHLLNISQAGFISEDEAATAEKIIPLINIPSSETNS